MNKSIMSRTMADRIAIERWEGEGGRPLTLEEPLGARAAAGQSSDPERGRAFDANAVAPPPAERAARSSSS